MGNRALPIPPSGLQSPGSGNQERSAVSPLPITYYPFPPLFTILPVLALPLVAYLVRESDYSLTAVNIGV